MAGSVAKIPFEWPAGKRAALSLSWDDARPSQLEHAVPVLDRFGAKGTFYVLPRRVRDQVAGWRAAVRGGHEIGNHTLTHPCSGNFPFSRGNSLEARTLPQMETELLEANRAIAELLDVTPATFAYCCGQTFVGRSAGVQSYVPLVARHFGVGRRCFDETCNDPAFCDLAQVLALDLDGRSFDDLRPVLHLTLKRGGWLIFVGHEVGGAAAPQTTRVETLERLAEFAAEPANGLWLDTVAAVGRYIAPRQNFSPAP